MGCGQILELKRYLEKKITGVAKPKLHDYDPNILPAAWLLLRWYVFIELGVACVTFPLP